MREIGLVDMLERYYEQRLSKRGFSLLRALSFIWQLRGFVKIEVRLEKKSCCIPVTNFVCCLLICDAAVKAGECRRMWNYLTLTEY